MSKTKINLEEEYRKEVNEILNKASKAPEKFYELFKFSYYPGYPSSIEEKIKSEEINPKRLKKIEKREILFRELKSKDLSGLVLKIIDSRLPSDVLFAKKINKIDWGCREDLINLIAEYAAKNTEVRDAVLQKIQDPKIQPEEYAFFCDIAGKAYDGKIFEVYKKILQSNSFGPWNYYKAEPLIKKIIEKTFSEDTSLELKERGLDFLLEEFEAIVNHNNINGVPRNIMYIAEIAEALKENQDNLNTEQSRKFKNYLYNAAEKLRNFAIAIALIYLDKTADQKLYHLFEKNPNAIKKYIEKNKVGEEIVSEVPVAGAVHDKRPYMYNKISKKLFEIYAFT